MTIASVLQAQMILNVLGAWVELEPGRSLHIENQDGVDKRFAFRVKLLSRAGEEVTCSGESLRDALAQVAQVVVPDFAVEKPRECEQHIGKATNGAPLICGAPAEFRYTWPGHDEKFACRLHALKLRGVAQAMGYHLQLIEVT
jgi:hypothetical protein